MVFSSLIFVWLFLPVILILYYVVKDEYKNLLLLLASLIFYAWGEQFYVLLMLFSIFFNWSMGLAIERYTQKKRLILIADLVVNLGILGYFKYFNFFVGLLYGIFGRVFSGLDLSLPIGISFFTFQILSYIIDLYRGKFKAQHNIVNMALYISFFSAVDCRPDCQIQGHQ